jgi:hypothetical protein
MALLFLALKMEDSRSSRFERFADRAGCEREVLLSSSTYVSQERTDRMCSVILTIATAIAIIQ